MGLLGRIMGSPSLLLGHNEILGLALQNAAGGILGLVCGMLLETTLFIIRTSGGPIASSSASSSSSNLPSASKLKKNQ